MTAIAGTVLAAKVTSGDTTTTFPVADSIEIKGGVKCVADSTARSAIPAARLEEGCLCYQQDTDIYYRWDGAAWVVWTAATILPADGYCGHYETPTAKIYPLDEYAVAAGTINSLRIALSAGTATVAIKINGTNVTGLSAVSVTTTQSGTNASAANTYAVGDRITLVVSSPSSAADLSFTLKCTLT